MMIRYKAKFGDKSYGICDECDEVKVLRKKGFKHLCDNCLSLS